MRETIKVVPEYPGIELVTPEKGMRFVRKSPNTPPAEYVRQLVLAKSRLDPLLPIPYLTHDLPHGSPAHDWYCSLTSDNPPGRCRFAFKGKREQYEAFRDVVSQIDMTTFDQGAATAIRQRHGEQSVPTALVSFDAEDAEIGGE